ncbi:MAG: methyltransferase domain-containing protein [Methylovirgula sp.]
MQIELPRAMEVSQAFMGWRLTNPILARLSVEYPQPHEALRRFGLALSAQGQSEPALGILKAALALAPDEADLWNDLAGASYRAGRYAEAGAAQLRSLDCDPVQPQGWLLLAAIDSALGDVAAAEAGYLAALKLDPHLSEAAFGLGLLCFQRRQFTETVKWLRQSIADGGHHMGLYVCLGQALFLLGDFAAAVSALESAAHFPSCDAGVVEKLAQLKLIETCVRADAAAAVAAYVQIAGPHANDVDRVAGTAFYFLSGFGYCEAAIRLGEWRLGRNPQDAVQRYLLAALRNEAVARAPDDYLVAYFDGFAETFEAKLVDTLGYRVPEKLHALLAKSGRRFTNALDLGCGTGLCAPLLRPLAGRLTGVDLSRGMLEKADARDLYDDLIEAEAGDFLDQASEKFDLVTAADFVIYFGDLAPLFERIARVMEPGGLLAFNAETAEAGFRVLPSGRFAQALDYIEAMAAPYFTAVELQMTTIRLEAAQPVEGALIVLQRL